MNKELLSSYEQEALMFTFNLLSNHLSPHYLYHNFQHTQETVNTCQEFANYYNINVTQKKILILSGIFHDTGHINDYLTHEEESCKIANNYLQEHQLPKSQINEVIDLIRSTKFDHKPQGLLQKILHDADMINLGKDSFFEKGKLLRVEWELILDKQYSDQEWEQMQYDLLSNYNFLTTYAQEHYTEVKNRNLAKQIEKIEQLKK